MTSSGPQHSDPNTEDAEPRKEHSPHFSATWWELVCTLFPALQNLIANTSIEKVSMSSPGSNVNLVGLVGKILKTVCCAQVLLPTSIEVVRQLAEHVGHVMQSLHQLLLPPSGYSRGRSTNHALLLSEPSPQLEHVLQEVMAVIRTAQQFCSSIGTNSVTSTFERGHEIPTGDHAGCIQTGATDRGR